MWFDPWIRKIPSWRRMWQRTLVLLPGESHRQRRLAGYTPQSCKKSDTTEATWRAHTACCYPSIHFGEACLSVEQMYLWKCKLGLFINPSRIYCHFLKKKLRVLSPLMQSIKDVSISGTNMLTNPCHLLKERRKTTYAVSGHKMLAQCFVLLNSTGHGKIIMILFFLSQS